MEIRVIKFEVPTTGDPAHGGAPYADQEVTTDANGHPLPATPARAWVCVANGAVSSSGTSGTTDDLTGSLGFSAATPQGTQSNPTCAAYYSRDNEGTTAAHRKTIARSCYIPHPDDTAGTWGNYADSCDVWGNNGRFHLVWNPVATGRGGTVVFWVVYGEEVQVASGTGTAPNNTSDPQTFRCTDVGSPSGETFQPTTIFLLAGNINTISAWQPGYDGSQTLGYEADAAMSFGMGTADPDGTNLAFRSLSWRDTSGAGTSASGLYFSDDYVVIGTVDGTGAISSPMLFDSVDDTGFTLDLRTGVTGFQFAFLALRSETTEVKLETFTTPSATGYADQAIGSPLGNPQGVLMIQTQVPGASIDSGMTNPVSATWGIGMGHQASLTTDPVSYSVGFQVEDNSGTSDTQSSWAEQLGYLVKKHGASATVSNFDWATHAAGSADATAVDWVTNTTATGVVNRQWAALFVGYGQQLFVGEQNDSVPNIVSVQVVASTSLISQSGPTQGLSPDTATVTVAEVAPAFAGLSSCVQTRTPTVSVGQVHAPTVLSLGVLTHHRNEPVAAVSFGDAVSAVTRSEPVAASVVSDAVAGWSRTEPVSATAVLDMVGSQ